MTYRPPVYISGLTYPKVKADRAAIHYNAFSSLITKFATGHPYTITKHDDAKRQLHVITVKLNPAPIDIPILVGEYAYQLRTALDHLAWQLGLLSGRKPSRSSSFPIQSGTGPKDRERFTRATWDIPCEAVDVIKSLQPYLRGKDVQLDPLWQLNKLCNLDKHQTVGVSHSQVRMWFSGEAGVAKYTPNYSAAEMAFLLPLALKDQVETKPLPPLLIFGKPIDAPGADFELTQEQIAEIHRYVTQDVFPRFARFFAHLPPYLGT